MSISNQAIMSLAFALMGFVVVARRRRVLNYPTGSGSDTGSLPGRRRNVATVAYCFLIALLVASSAKSRSMRQGVRGLTWPQNNGED